MDIEKNLLIIVTDDHGGYLEGFCAVCRASGWLSDLKHKEGCPVATAYNYLTITPTKEKDNLDPECSSCGETFTDNEFCPQSKRPCGHHCNHVWTHDVCCWCGHEFGEEDS